MFSLYTCKCYQFDVPLYLFMLPLSAGWNLFGWYKFTSITKPSGMSQCAANIHLHQIVTVWKCLQYIKVVKITFSNFPSLSYDFFLCKIKNVWYHSIMNKQAFQWCGANWCTTAAAQTSSKTGCAHQESGNTTLSRISPHRKTLSLSSRYEN